MDHQHRFQEDRSYGGSADHNLQPAWFCVPQIKVENDLGIYHCQTSQYSNSVIHSTSSYEGFNQGSVDCHSPYRKSGMSMTNPLSSDFCDSRRAPHVNTGFSEQSRSTTSLQHNVGMLCHNLSLSSENSATRYPLSDERNESQLVNEEAKRGKPWCEDLQTRLFSRNKEQVFSPTQEPNEKSKPTQGVNDDCESRQAFDLTCRSKSPSKEDEGSSDGSVVTVNEESSNVQAQGRCTPKPQTCKVCGKVLSSPSSYYVHMKVHSGSKPYECTMCEASFCRKPYLEVHMRTHTGERPFQCDTCNKRFTQKSSLNTHKRVHTGERPYACDICQKTFAVKSYVTAHRWSHVSEKPLGCERCGLTFTSRNLYALHIRTHVEQNHECRLCGRTFMKDSYLIRHQNRVHGEAKLTSEIDGSRSSSQSPPAEVSYPSNT